MRRIPPNPLALAYLDALRAGRAPPYVSPYVHAPLVTPPPAQSVVRPVAAATPVGVVVGPVAVAPPASPASPVPTPNAIASTSPWSKRSVVIAIAAAIVVAVLVAASLVHAQTARRRRPPHEPGAPIARTLSVPAESRALVSATPVSAAATNGCSAPAVASAAVARDASPVPTSAPRDVHGAHPLPPRYAPATPLALGIGYSSNAVSVVFALVALAVALRRRRAPQAPPPRVPPPREGAKSKSPAIARPFAIESRPGPVRARCEDRSLAFAHRDVTALIVADGLGGGAHGDRAAEIVVAAVHDFLRRELRRRPRPTVLTALAREAISAAGAQLEQSARAYNIDPTVQALESTAIVLLADAQRFACAYLGDGGACVVRADGAVEPIMVAQKGTSSNLVGGCLGPRGVDGTIETREVARRAGDVAVVGSDGVFDRVAPEFVVRLRDLVRQCGPVARGLGEALDALERAHDDQGPFADDNLTLGVLTTAE